MAVDFQVCYPVDLIPLTSVSERTELDGTRILTVLGTDFRVVDQVLVNGTKSPTVLIQSRTKMQVTVPEVIGTQAVTDVAVYSNSLTLSSRSRLTFKLGEVTGKTSGMMRLIQLFLKLLFTSPGKDIFDPQLGGNALKNVSHTFGRGQGSVVVSDFVIAVDRTARQMIAIQARDSLLPREEKLLNAKVEAATFEASSASLITTIALTNQAGKVGIANVVV